MVLSAEEAAELARLQAKDAEPPAEVRTLSVSLPADVADVVRQLVQVHWQSIAPEVGSTFVAAVAEAEAAAAEPAPAAEPQASEGVYDPEPAADAGALVPHAFGSESDPGTEPAE